MGILKKWAPPRQVTFKCPPPGAHHDNLKSSQNFENQSIIKKFQSNCFFCSIYVKTITQNFSEYGVITLQVATIQQALKDTLQICFKFEKTDFEENSELFFCQILNKYNSELGKSNFP